jgi:hypothetical protein
MKGNRRSALVFFLGLFLLGVSLACAGTSTPKISTATPKPGEGQTQESRPTGEAPDASAPPSQSYLGDADQDNGYALTAMAVADPAEAGVFYQPEEGKRLFGVEIILANLSGGRIGSNPVNAALIDGDGYVYDMELAGVKDQMPLVSLDPGEQVRGWVGFTIPENAVPVAVKYTVAPLKKEFLQAGLEAPPEGHVPVAVTVMPNPPPANLGDVVEQYGFSLTASQVENPATPGRFYAPKAGTRLAAVEITLANVSAADPLYVNPIACFLVDDGGFVHPVTLGGRDGQIGVVELAAGEKATGWVAYAIPENAAPLYIKYQTHLLLGNFLSTSVA